MCITASVISSYLLRVNQTRFIHIDIMNLIINEQIGKSIIENVF